MCIHCPIVCRLDSASPDEMSPIWAIFAAIWCKVVPIFFRLPGLTATLQYCLLVLSNPTLSDSFHEKHKYTAQKVQNTEYSTCIPFMNGGVFLVLIHRHPLHRFALICSINPHTSLISSTLIQHFPKQPKLFSILATPINLRIHLHKGSGAVCR